MTIENSLKRQGIDILKKEQNSLDGAFERQAKEKAPPENNIENIIQKSDGTWTTKTTKGPKIYDEDVIPQKEKEFKDEAEVLQNLCKRVDDKIIVINNEINALKQQIVTLSTEATGRNCNPGLAHSTGNVGIVSSFSAASSVNNDVEFVKIYEPMAGPGFNPGAENPFDPDSIVILNPSYSGFGYKNKRDNNEVINTSDVATGLGIDGSGASIGVGRFDITTPAATHGPGIAAVGFTYPGAGGILATDTSLTGVAAQNRCVAIASSISTIYGEIIEKRVERDSLRSALNSVKKKKMEKELGHWGYQNMKTEVGRRKTQNSEAISAIERLDTKEGGVPLPEGLQLDLDASNNSSYYGSGTLWYDLADREDVLGNIIPGNDASLEGGVENNFIVDPISDERNHFDFDGVDDHVDFTAPNISATTPTVTVEVLAELNIDLDVADSAGYILFGWNQYSVWTGSVIGNGTPFALGFNTGNTDLYGLSSTKVNNLNINNNFIHYVFEMRSDVSYTNNKIYINGNLQPSLEDLNPSFAETVVSRNFNSGVGRIAGWRSDINYRMPMGISLFRVYNKALTQEEVKERFNAVGGRFL